MVVFCKCKFAKAARLQGKTNLKQSLTQPQSSTRKFLDVRYSHPYSLFLSSNKFFLLGLMLQDETNLKQKHKSAAESHSATVISI